MLTLIAGWFAAPGQHRAADRITVLQAERDGLLAQLVDTDKVVNRYAAQRVHDAARIETLTETINALTVENEALRGDWDELYARYREVEAALANLKAINVPAPADLETLPPHLYDEEDTQELPVAAIQKVIPLHEKAIAA
jgi:hypothetical protein